MASDYQATTYDRALRSQHIEEHYKKLDKLLWDMQDTFDELVQEGLNQPDAISDFESVFSS
jgi:hypothetical protein